VAWGGATERLGGGERKDSIPSRFRSMALVLSSGAEGEGRTPNPPACRKTGVVGSTSRKGGGVLEKGV